MPVCLECVVVSGGEADHLIRHFNSDSLTWINSFFFKRFDPKQCLFVTRMTSLAETMSAVAVWFVFPVRKSREPSDWALKIPTVTISSLLHVEFTVWGRVCCDADAQEMCVSVLYSNFKGVSLHVGWYKTRTRWCPRKSDYANHCITSTFLFSINF